MINFLTLGKYGPLKATIIPLIGILGILTLAAKHQDPFRDEQFIIFGFFFLILPVANGYYLKRLFLDNLILIICPFKPRKKIFYTILNTQIVTCTAISLTVTLSSIAISRQFPGTTSALKVGVGMALGLLLITTIHTTVFLISKRPFIAYLATMSGLFAIFVAFGGTQPTTLHFLSPLHVIEKLAVQLHASTVISATILSSISLIISEKIIHRLSIGEDL